MSAPTKILVALQFWEGDRAQAGKLTEYLADLEKTHNDQADFLLVNRFDCKPLAKEQAYLSRKFNIFSYQSPRGATGWPYGCNSLAASTVTWAYRMGEAKRIPTYKAIFTCESDGCPVFADWISRMSFAWDTVNVLKPVCIAGPLVQVPAEHINGNCLIGGSIANLQWMSRCIHGVHSGGWDFVLANEFRNRGWANIAGMLSLYNTRDYTLDRYNRLVQDNVIWVHGCKDSSLMDLGRIHILGADNVPAL